MCPISLSPTQSLSTRQKLLRPRTRIPYPSWSITRPRFPCLQSRHLPPSVRRPVTPKHPVVSYGTLVVHSPRRTDKSFRTPDDPLTSCSENVRSRVEPPLSTNLLSALPFPLRTLFPSLYYLEDLVSVFPTERRLTETLNPTWSSKVGSHGGRDFTH